MARCWGSSSQFVHAPRVASADTCLFAIGDIHGHADELEALHTLVVGAARRSDMQRKVLVYLGDYVDRGPEIVRTIELLIEQSRLDDGIERVFLAGNHDQFVVELLAPSAEVDLSFVTMWLDNGGDRTLEQFGVEGYDRLAMAGDMAGLSQCLRRAIGDDACAFFAGLRAVHREVGYVFVHAGIDPALSLDQQDIADLLLSREPFLSCRTWQHDFCVVHGHSVAMPRVLPHRIGVDAGCYCNGALCAVQIEGDCLRFLGVTRRSGFDWNRVLSGRQAEWRWAEARAVDSTVLPAAS